MSEAENVIVVDVSYGSNDPTEFVIDPLAPSSTYRIYSLSGHPFSYFGDDHLSVRVVEVELT